MTGVTGERVHDGVAPVAVRLGGTILVYRRISVTFVAGKGAASPCRSRVGFDCPAGDRRATAVAIGGRTGAEDILRAFRQEIVQRSVVFTRTYAARVTQFDEKVPSPDAGGMGKGIRFGRMIGMALRTAESSRVIEIVTPVAAGATGVATFRGGTMANVTVAWFKWSTTPSRGLTFEMTAHVDTGSGSDARPLRKRGRAVSIDGGKG